MDFDKQGNIYILDNLNSTINIYNNNGKFVKKIGGKGNGPGEFTYAFNIFIKNDTIIVIDQPNKSALKYNTNGSFIYKKELEQLPYHLQVSKNNTLIGFVQSFNKKDNNEMFFSYDLAFLNNQFKVENYIHKKTFKYSNDINMLDVITPYISYNNLVYVSENKDNRYRINVYNTLGDTLYFIEKRYANIALEKYEYNQYIESNKIINKGVDNAYTPKLTALYKKPINDIYIDKYGNLLVLASVKRTSKNAYNWFFDVFKEGIWQKRLKIQFPKECIDFHDYSTQLYFKNDKIYFLDLDRSIITVYSYKIK